MLGALLLALALMSLGARTQESPVETFQKAALQSDGSITTKVGTFFVGGEGRFELTQPRGWDEGQRALRMPGGTENATVLRTASSAPQGGTFEFFAQRDGLKRPFQMTAVLITRAGEEIRHDLTQRVNARHRQEVVLPAPKGLVEVRLLITAPATRGVFIDDCALRAPSPMTVTSVVHSSAIRPLVADEFCTVGELLVDTAGALNPLLLTDLRVEVASKTGPDDAAQAPDEAPKGFTVQAARFGAESTLAPGPNRIPIQVKIAPSAGGQEALLDRGSLRAHVLIGGEERTFDFGADSPFRMARRILPADRPVDSVSLLRGAWGTEQALICAVGTGKGSLALVCAAPEKTWLESADWPSDLTRPALVSGPRTAVVHALGQLADGTWRRATSSTLGKSWSVAADAPLADGSKFQACGGRGIESAAGFLFVPIIEIGGFRIKDEPCATLMMSRDGGGKWTPLKPPFPNTTSSAVVEIGDESLMINMANGRGARRAERVTRNYGESWNNRHTDRRATLDGAGGAGAQIHLGREFGAGMDGRMLFANAATRKLPLRAMTLKGSSDNGDTWPAELHQVLDDGVGVNHPGIAMVDRTTIAVVYQPSTGGLIVQLVRLDESIPRTGSVRDVTGGR